MATCCRHILRLRLYNCFTHRLITSHPCQRRSFHDYWTQKSPSGVSLRIPILKARHHLGALSSRGDRPENEDRFKVGLLNKLSDIEEHQPFYFAIIDGYYVYRIVINSKTWRKCMCRVRRKESSQ